MSFTKRVNKEIQLYQKDNFILPNLIIKPSDNLNLWYFVIYDLKDTDYSGGVYLGKIKLPDKYPFKAPDFSFLTPSGRFEINKNVCTSFTGYHQELYSPSWNIGSMCCGLISFMTDSTDSLESHGIGKISSTAEYKKDVAKKSIMYIKENKPILDIFNTFFSEYFTKLGL